MSIMIKDEAEVFNLYSTATRRLITANLQRSSKMENLNNYCTVHYLKKYDVNGRGLIFTSR